MSEFEQSPESTEQVSESVGTETSPQQEQSNVPDLNSMEKFKFEGKEWSPADFRNAYMMQADYTRKTQEIAQERKYYDNLNYDLKKVSERPDLASEFKRIYPEKFHAYLDYVMKQNNQQQNQSQSAGQNPEWMDRFTKVETALIKQQTDAINAKLDAMFSGLSKKYQLGNENEVLARAEYLHSKGHELDDKTWEQLWKESHDRLSKLADQYYAEKVKSQKSINQKGKDVASGGGIPGNAPKKPRTIKEASVMALQELEGN